VKVANVAVWGLGPHAIKNILPSLNSCPELRLYGVCSRNSATVSRVASQYQCQSWADSVAMLKDQAVDVVYLSTPIGLHAMQGKSVLLAHKHLWCEKPLATDLKQTLELAGISRANGVSLAEAFMYLYHPQFGRLRQIIESGRLGDLQQVTIRFGIPPLDKPGFRGDPSLGGGAFLDVGSYLTSAITGLLGAAEPEVLFSEITKSSGSPVDTSGQAILSYPVLGNPVNIILEWGINRAYRNEIDLWGSGGSVTSERVFSKPADYVPKFRFLDLHGNESFEFGQPENHFLTMFGVFLQLTHDAKAAERERIDIVRRAGLLDKIQRKKI
jgi:predicted dehydrogenase